MDNQKINKNQSKIFTKLLFTSIPFIIMSCTKQKAIKLKIFDFETKISTFILNEKKDKTYDNQYQIISKARGVNTISDGEFIGTERAVRVEYSKDLFSSKLLLRRFDNFDLNPINFAIRFDGVIKVFNDANSKTLLWKLGFYRKIK